MSEDSRERRAIAFFDGQNLFRHAKDAFGHHHPNYDPVKLTKAVCAAKGWTPVGVRFYTGVPDAARSPMWHGYWTRRLTEMRRAGVAVTTRRLHYRVEQVRLADGTTHDVPVQREKGIDLRLGLDVVRLARNADLDVALVFSQDQDLAEVAREVVNIARDQDRWLKIVSAFPYGNQATSLRGIDRTDWFRMDRTFYDACLDPRDYRPNRQSVRHGISATLRRSSFSNSSLGPPSRKRSR